MACTDCKICTLITSDILCLYSPLKGITLNSINSVVDAANQYLLDLTGTCDICIDYSEPTKYKYTDMLANESFRRLYAQLIYYYWLPEYGDGRPSKEGIVSKEDDTEFSEFRVHKRPSIKSRIESQLQKVQRSETKFLEYFKNSYSTCFESTEINASCCNECKQTKCTCINKSVDIYDGMVVI